VLLALALLGGSLLLASSSGVAVSLSLMQGLAEFLPISSSAHLILMPWFLGWPDPGLTFDIALHVGTLLAVACYLWRDWLRLLSAAPHPRTPDGRLFWLLVVGAVPGGIAGVLLDNLAEQALRAPMLIAGALALYV
jgi:undecaprenyl-diphosphatase